MHRLTRLLPELGHSVSGTVLSLPGQPEGIASGVHTLLFSEPELLLDAFDIFVTALSGFRGLVALWASTRGVIEETPGAILGFIAREEFTAVLVDVRLSASIDVANTMLTRVLASAVIVRRRWRWRRRC